MKQYSSSEILAADDLYELQDTFACSGIPFKYQLTADEIGWLDFVRGRYSIADYILETLEDDVMTFDCPFTMSDALDDDCGGAGKAVCLSDDTALQRLFFWLYSQSEDEG